MARWVGFSGDSAQVWFMFPVSSHPPLFDSWLAPSMGGGSPRPFLKSGMQPAWSPDGSKVAYHTAAPGDPIFIADRTGRDPKQIFNEQPGVHCHFLIWSPDGRFIYFVKGIVATEEMDIWRIRSSGGGPSERLTYHNSRVAYPAWLDSRTLVYSATAEDGSGQWLYAIDVERRIPHRVSSGVAEQYHVDCRQRHPAASAGGHRLHSQRRPLDDPTFRPHADRRSGESASRSLTHARSAHASLQAICSSFPRKAAATGCGNSETALPGSCGKAATEA